MPSTNIRLSLDPMPSRALVPDDVLWYLLPLPLMQDQTFLRSHCRHRKSSREPALQSLRSHASPHDPGGSRRSVVFLTSSDSPSGNAEQCRLPGSQHPKRAVPPIDTNTAAPSARSGDVLEAFCGTLFFTRQPMPPKQSAQFWPTTHHRFRDPRIIEKMPPINVFGNCRSTPCAA
jgi:hypothetical protein